MKSTPGEGSLSWYAVPAAQVIEKLGTNQEAGLGSGEVSERLKNTAPTVFRPAASAARSCGS